jgi:hypothetical protein
MESVQGAKCASRAAITEPCQPDFVARESARRASRRPVENGTFRGNRGPARDRRLYPEPASGGYASGSDHIQLTPLKTRVSFEQFDSDPMAGPSLPQY